MIVWMKVLNFTKIKVDECEDLMEKIWGEGRMFGEDGPIAIFIIEKERERKKYIYIYMERFWCVCVYI